MRIAASSAVLVVLVAASALATEPIRFSLDYSAPRDCPAVAGLVERIQTRLPGAHRDATAPSHADVVISRSTRGFNGELSWAGDDSGARHFKGARCDEVVDALALAITVALSGQRSGSQPAKPSPANSAAPPANSAAPPAASAAPPVAAAPVSPPARSLPPSRRPLPSRRAGTTSPRSGRRWHGAVVASFGITGDVAPAIAPVGSAAFELGMGGTRLLSPSLRVSFDYARGAATDPTFSGFHRIAGGLELCPLRFAVREPALSLEPCVGARAGVHAGELRGGGSASTVWLSVDALARARWAPSPRWFVELSGGTELPTSLNRFWVEDPAQGTRRRAFVVPQVAGIAAVGVGVTIF